MSIIAAIAVVALAALLVWKIGAPLGRFGGAVVVVYSLVFVIAGDPFTERAPLLAIGAVMWLGGHFLAAYQGRYWRSRLAEAITVHTPLRYLDPVHGRERRQLRRADRAARRRAREDAADEAATSSDVDVDHFAEWEDELTNPAPAKPRRTTASRPVPRSSKPHRGVVYGKRAAKVAASVATRTVPGARIARSAWRFLR